MIVPKSVRAAAQEDLKDRLDIAHDVLHCDSHASPEQRLDALHSFDERLATRD